MQRVLPLRETCRILSTNVWGAEGQSPIIECAEEVAGRSVWGEYCGEALPLPRRWTSHDEDEAGGGVCPLHITHA